METCCGIQWRHGAEHEPHRLAPIILRSPSHEIEEHPVLTYIPLSGRAMSALDFDTLVLITAIRSIEQRVLRVSDVGIHR